ncbi:hypothetical protein ACJX0J_028533 [Zea mays]
MEAEDDDVDMEQLLEPQNQDHPWNPLDPLSRLQNDAGTDKLSILKHFLRAPILQGILANPSEDIATPEKPLEEGVGSVEPSEDNSVLDKPLEEEEEAKEEDEKPQQEEDDNGFGVASVCFFFWWGGGGV